MKAGLIGPSYQQASLPWDAQRSIGLWPIIDEGGKEPASMYSVPGYKSFAQVTPLGVGRGCYEASNGRAFSVIGSQFIELLSNGTVVSRGTLPESVGYVTFADNGFQLAICDGTRLFMFVFNDNSFRQITGGTEYVTDGSFPDSTTAWTPGAEWSLYEGFARAEDSNDKLEQTVTSSLVQGNRYTVSYKVGNIQYVSNGSFTTSEGWTLGTGWSISTGAARKNVGTISAITQIASKELVEDAKYIVTFRVTRTSGNISASIGGGTAGTAINTSQVVTQTLTAGSTQVISFSGSLVGSIDDISVIDEITGSVVFSLGGNNGSPRNQAGSYTEVIEAGSSQDISFTGTGFTGTISEVSVRDVSSGFISASSVTFLDGYFVISRSLNSGIFQISGLYDGFTWGSLDFATAESSPDNLKRVISVGGQLWLVGVSSIEIWAHTGSLGFPFQRVTGAKIEHGTMGIHSMIAMDNHLFWAGRSKEGVGIIFKANGFTPERISTETIESVIQKVSQPESLKFCSYQERGHTFLMITGGGMQTAWVYDLNTSMWHERALLNEEGVIEQPRINDIMFVFNKHIGCSRTPNGLLYHQSLDYLDDDGEELLRERTFTHIFDEKKRIKFPYLVIDFEAGVGNQTPPGEDPKCMLCWSNDGAKTWTDWREKPLGKAGKFLTRVIFWRLGQARQRTYKVRITDPVIVHITGAYFDGQ